MKKIVFLLSFTVLGYFSSMSQSIVKAEPYKTQGWLVLQPNSQIVTWRIVLYQRVKTSDTTYVDKIVKQIEMGDINYIQVPDNYFTDGNTYVYIVTGLNKDGKVVNEEGPLFLTPPPPVQPGGGGIDYELVHTYKCNGKTYAWELQEYRSTTSNMGYFYLTETYSSTNNQTYIPYYQYMGQTQYDAVRSPNATIDGIPTTDYNIYNYIGYPPDNTLSNDVIKITSSNQNYYDSFDMPLSNTASIYGVKKSLGKWNVHTSAGTNFSYTTHIIELPMGAIDKYVAMNYFNAYAYPSDYNFPLLECDECTHIIIPPHPPNVSGVIKEAKKQWMPPDSLSSGSDFYDFVDTIFSSWFTDWWNPNNSNWWITEINIIPFDTTIQPIDIRTEDFLLPNNEFNAPKFVLYPDLYRIEFTLNTGFTFPIYKEVKRKILNYYELSHFLHVNAYPTPITGDQFTLHLTADVKLKFDYELVDFNGTVLYTKNFVLQKGHDRTHTIKVHDGIPTGILFHRFIFEDGSQISIETCK